MCMHMAHKTACSISLAFMTAFKEAMMPFISDIYLFHALLKNLSGYLLTKNPRILEHYFKTTSCFLVCSFEG